MIRLKFPFSKAAQVAQAIADAGAINALSITTEDLFSSLTCYVYVYWVNPEDIAVQLSIKTFRETLSTYIQK